MDMSHKRPEFVVKGKGHLPLVPKISGVHLNRLDQLMGLRNHHHLVYSPVQYRPHRLW